MFERLLLAIDDTPGSELAIDFATAFAQQFSASIHVLHVNEFQVGGRGLTLHTEDEARELLGHAVLQLRASGLSATGSICVDSYRHVATRIVETAYERGADAIVLGSHRHRGFDRLFSSRIRDRTTRLTALPVLTAPSPLSISAAKVSIRELVQAQLDRTISRRPI